MKKKLLIVAAVALVWILVYKPHTIQPKRFDIHVTQPKRTINYTVNPKLIAADNAFGFNLLLELAKENKNKNVFISPTSVATVAQMVYNGARGDTKAAMGKTLQLKGLSVRQLNLGSSLMTWVLENADPDIQIDIANSLWTDDKLKSSFEQDCKHFYNAETGPKDFKKVNSWVNHATRGKIPDIMDGDVPGAVLYLVNAVYFKGNWTHKFNKTETRSDDFKLADGKVKTVQMMHQTMEFGIMKGNGFRAIKLPYGSQRLAMYIFLPDEKSNMQEFTKKLNAKNWNLWMNGFGMEKETILSLPRFKCEYKTDLEQVLTTLGMGVAFEEGRADFDFFNTPRSPWISQAIHKTYLGVDEQGTTAAAVTMMVGSECYDSSPRSFTIDRPFFCAIRDDKTGAVLFAGFIYNPEE